MCPRFDGPAYRWYVLLLMLSSSALFAADGVNPSMQAGHDAFRRGALEEAAHNWAAAARAAQRAGKPYDQIAALEYVAQAHLLLGRYQSAIELLETALAQLGEAPDLSRRTALLAALGNAYIAVGPAETAENYLQRSLALAKQAGDAGRTAAILNDLGNLHSSQQQHVEAIVAYQQSARVAREGEHRVTAARALANLSKVYAREGKGEKAAEALRTAELEARQMRMSHEAVYTWIQIGTASSELRPRLPQESTRLLEQSVAALNAALTIAERLVDLRGVSSATGHLGSLYEEQRQYADALALTRRAIVAAQRANAPELLYRWQWQSARLLAQIAGRDDAIAAYRRALYTLKSVRSGFTATYAAPGWSFRDTAGRIYFEFVDLLLQRAAARSEGGVENDLAEARDTIELFRVAELRDYFRDDCVDTVLRTTRLDAISPTAVVIYPIVLRDRTEILLTLPSGLKRVQVPVGAERLTAAVRQLRFALEKRTTREFMPLSQQLYSWLIAPIDPQLASFKIDTLVFVPDGPLRTIPMAALHDGSRFLIEKFALAVTPGLNVTDPRPVARERLRVLAAGVTQPVQGFPPLPNVSLELESLRTLFGGTTLVDEAFRVPDLERQLKSQSFNVVHIASHGQFGSDVSNTFLLAFDRKVTIDMLETLIGVLKFRKEPLELLTLSACETAAGDDRAALGLAGIAIKSGARSALATLWHINDEISSRLVADFYRALSEPSTSRAEALRRAQVRVLADARYDHPGFWAPFLMINNWL